MLLKLGLLVIHTWGFSRQGPGSYAGARAGSHPARREHRSMGPPVERELKFLIPNEAAYQNLKELLGAPQRTLRQVNYYLDSKDRQVARSRSMVRIRDENGRAVLTYKRQLAHRSGYLECEEHEEEVPAGWVAELQQGHVPEELWIREPLRRLAQDLGSCGLGLVGTITNERGCYPLAGGEVAELDRTEFSDGGVDFELEVETERPEQVGQIVRELFQRAGAPLRPQPLTKYRRFLDRLLK